MKKTNASRRAFVKKLSLGTAAASFAPLLGKALQSRDHVLMEKNYPVRRISANDRIRLATIGFGIQDIGDTMTAEKSPRRGIRGRVRPLYRPPRKCQ